MKSSKKIKFFTFLSVSSLAIFSFGFGMVNKTSESINRVNATEHALANDTTQEQSSTTYTVTQNPTATNRYANEIKDGELQALLTPANAAVNFTVVILPVTEQNLNQGSLDFLIYEKLYKNNGYQVVFADATKSMLPEVVSRESSTGAQSENNISSEILSKYKQDSTIPEQKNVFSTLKFPNLNGWIKKKQYSINWKSDNEIANFIKSKNTPGLTSDDVWLNLIDNSTLPPLKSENTRDKRDLRATPQTTIEVTKVTNAQGDGGQLGDVGLFKIEIKVDGQDQTTLDDNQNQRLDQVKYLGGFPISDESTAREEFKLVGNSNIGDMTVSDPNIFNVGDKTAEPTTKLSELTASEFASPNGGTKTLIDIVTQNSHVNNGNSEQKIFSLSYGGISNIQFNKKLENQPENYATSTGAPTFEEIVNSLKITKIDTVPNDSNGSLQMVLYYDVFDVYKGGISSKVSTFNFPAGTFKVNPNADKNLFITWKTDDALENMQYAYEVVNEYYKNRNNAEFTRIFSNRFLNTTDSVKAMDRQVEIDYGSVSGSESGGQWITSNDNTVKVKLTFPNWGSDNKSFTIENTFTLLGYKYGDESSGDPNKTDVLNFSWKSNETLFGENTQYTELTPSNIALNLITNNDQNNSLIYSKFILGDNPNGAASRGMQISIKPDDINGTMMVYVKKSSENIENTENPANYHVYQQMFVGFKKANNASDVTSFAFIPQSDVSSKLLGIPLTSVTKTDVLNLYLKEIDLFKDRTLTEDNVEIVPVINPNGDSYLQIKVTIPTFDQSVPGIDTSKQTFFTTISGFSVINPENMTKFNPPKDYTAIISISSAVSISVILGMVLIGLLVKRAGVKTYKKNDDLIGQNNKKTSRK